MFKIRAIALIPLVLLLSLSTCSYAAQKLKVDAKLARTYENLASEVSAVDLGGTIQDLSSMGSRVAGYSGNYKAAKYVEDQFRKIGLEQVKAEPFYVSVPVDEGASLQVGAKKYKLHPMWPNLVRTSHLPKGGVTGSLIYGGTGKLSEFDGYDVTGSIVLMEFNSGSEWMNAPRLGAKAVIFIEPESTMRGEAEAKFISIPISIPRFWISKSDAAALRALCAVSAAPQVNVQCKMHWQRKLVNNVTGIIPGADPKLRDQIIVIESYFDSTSVIPTLAPGAESACGIASMLELAEIYKKHPPARTVWFIATNAHYQSLQGMREYLNRHLPELQKPSTRARIAAFFNKDKKLKETPKIYLFAGLDLSSQTKGVGIFYKGYFYDIREDIQNKFSDIARVCRENSEKIGAVLGFDPGKTFADGVNPIAGKNWRNFIPGKIALDAEAVTLAGARGVSFVSTDDSRAMVDTPFDTPEKVNIANLEAQTRHLACLFHHILNDTNDPQVVDVPKFPITEPSVFSRMTLQGGFALLKGQVLILNLRKGFIPNDPVPESLVVWRGYQVGGGNVFSKTLMGVRGSMIQMVNGKGQFAFPGIAPLTAHGGAGRLAVMAAYRLDPETGEIVYAPDMGIFGADFYPTNIAMSAGVKEIPLVVFKCRATSIFDLIDPQALRTLPLIDIFEGDTNGRPRMFGYSLAVPEWQVSHVEDCAVIFTQPKTLLKIVMAAGPAATRLVLINSTKESPEGAGYVVGDGNSITNTSLKVAKDMWALDEYRIKRLAKYRIINEGIDKLHAMAKAEIVEAEKALNEKRYSLLDSHARAAWGYEARAYPDVQKTAKDVVNGVLFYMALMIPFAYFCERLFFGFADLKRQLAAVFVIFAVIFAIFKQSHPAFDITMNPTIVFIAFIMLALSVLVTVIVSNKFEEQLKALNRQMSGVHKVDIGRMSIAAAAFSLGISNMRRRKARTVLTCITLVLLTFIVLSFTSIVQTMRFNKVPAPGKPAYNGLMLRTAMWEPLQEPAYQLLRDEFGSTRAVAPRAWYFGAILGEQSFLTLKRNDKTYDAKGVVGLTKEETRVTHADKALLPGGRWFKPGDTYVTIIPGAIATALEITPEDVGKAKVIFSGVEYTVIGIVDNAKFKEVTDLDREPLTPVDFILMQKLNAQGKSMGEAGFREYVHLEPDTCFFVPYQTLMNLGGDIRSIAIDFVTPKEVQHTLDKLMPRLGLNLYAGLGERTFRYSSIATQSSKGFTVIFIPILIAAMIVLNTMLGSVYERVKEIGIFSSLGLAPNHIAMLFMAEAMVYAILGAVAGYLIGQGASKILVMTNLLPGLYLNFSSTSAVLSTLIVVAVVLLSTIYPARKASEVATPAIERSWKVADPVGDIWKIALPFAVTGEQAKGVSGFIAEWFQAYEEYSVGDFVTQDVCSDKLKCEHGVGYSVKCRTWLAPFDLGVSQHVCLETIPTAMEDVYDLRLTILRESGDISNWKRVNRRFLNTLRKQFLIWRTMKADERERYLAAGTEAESSAAAAASTAGSGAV